jgi:hypothetical protein
MPVHRAPRKPRGLKREDQTDMAQADLGDELLEPEPPIAAGARAAGVLIDDRDRPRRPAEFDRALRSAYWRAADSTLRSTCPTDD